MKAFAAIADAYVPFSKTFCDAGNPLLCPDKATGAFLSLLGFDITTIKAEWVARSEAYAVDAPMVAAPSQTDWWLSHYVRPRKMLALHERTLHEKIDRMQSAVAAANEKSPEEGKKHSFVLEKWKASFLRRHQQIVQRKVQQLEFFGISLNSTFTFTTSSGSSSLHSEETGKIITGGIEEKTRNSSSEHVNIGNNNKVLRENSAFLTEIAHRAHSALFGTKNFAHRAHSELFGAKNNVINYYLRFHNRVSSLIELDPHAMITAHLDMLREMQVLMNGLARRKFSWHDDKDIPPLSQAKSEFKNAAEANSRVREAIA